MVHIHVSALRKALPPGHAAHAAARVRARAAGGGAGPRALRAAAARGPRGARRGRRRDGRGPVRGGARAVARAGAGGVQRAVRARRGRAPARAPGGLRRGPDRRRPRARSPRGPGGRAREPRGLQPAAGAAAGAADGRALPLGPPGRRARRLPDLPRDARGRAGAGAVARGCASSSGGSCARTRRSKAQRDVERGGAAEDGADPLRAERRRLLDRLPGGRRRPARHRSSCTGSSARSSPAGSGRRSASFYRGLARFGRLILFDKRGTGLSDRVLGIASLEERMDDVRAVLDAVGPSARSSSASARAARCARCSPPRTRTARRR